MEKNRINTGKIKNTDRAGNPAGGDKMTNRIQDLPEADILKYNTSRRDFLKVFGFSFASAALLASCRRPVHMALPYIKQPPEITPGKPLYYASTFYDGHEYAGILVKTRDGRPIKIEGNELSLFNGNGTTARVQASVLSLYDDARLKNPSMEGKPYSWDKIDKQVIDKLAKINSDGGEIVLLTSSIISPSTLKLTDEFGKGFAGFRHVRYDPVSYSALIEANELCFGSPVIPDYHFGNSDLIVSVNADFLGTWLAPVHFIPGYTSRRKLNNGEKDMLKHIQFESGMSLTGANADIRKKIKPSEEKILVTDLYNKIAGKTGAEKIPGRAYREDLSGIAGSLLKARGRSVVLSGTNDVDIQIIINGINSLLGNYGDCIDLANDIKSASATDGPMEALTADLAAGKVKAVIMYNVNPVYDYYKGEEFAAALKNTELSVNMAGSVNETSEHVMFDCPVPHYLESWDDAEIIRGQLSLSQPCINPLFNTRSFQDSLLKWSGSNIEYHKYLMANWEKSYFPLSGMSDFTKFWEDSLGKGIFSYEPERKSSFSFDRNVLTKIKSIDDQVENTGFEVILYESVALGNGKYSNNPWLMELPDPVSKQCWENVAAVSIADAGKIGIQTGDMIKLGEGFIIPAFLQPGQADGTISVALGYGHKNYGPVCTGTGLNVYQYARNDAGSRAYNFRIEKIEKTEEVRELALSQVHYSMEGRPIVRETTLEEYKKDPSSGNEFHMEYLKKDKTLYPDVKYDGFHWGLAIDLNACVGCNACVIACQAENNIPVVGKEEVRKRRIMHWIRIDRYYSDDEDDPKVYFQPLTCQHCDNAPCENVCPVSATNHSSEGLNQMIYNRCVGTKYCINNCPYKVRHFNWFRYTNNKVFDYNTASDLGKMVLNPDVTVRERGVVEKCSFCVQRIQEKKLQAKLENRTLRDYEIQTACMQACPAGALVFGNLNDPASKVSGMFGDQRCYQLLEELHTLPSAGFLTKVRNVEDTESKLTG